MDITNKTRKPISIPLPGGKKLFLGPGKTGQVAHKALAFPPLAKLLEAGDLEASGDSSERLAGGGSSEGPTPGPRYTGTGAIRQSGDR